MTPQQALTLLTNATANIPTTRQQHQQIAQALEVLAAAVAPKIAPAVELKK